MQTHSKYFFIGDSKNRSTKGSELILITDNFSTPENIGSIIRLAANLGSDKVIVTGSSECRQSKIKKTAGAALGHVNVIYCDYNNLSNYIPDDFEMIALETATGAKNIYEVEMPGKMALVLGNEKFGVSIDLLSKCSKAYYIPMTGPIKSMNVSHAASVCAFEWMRQILLKQ